MLWSSQSACIHYWSLLQESVFPQVLWVKFQSLELQVLVEAVLLWFELQIRTEYVLCHSLRMQKITQALFKTSHIRSFGIWSFVITLIFHEIQKHPLPERNRLILQHRATIQIVSLSLKSKRLGICAAFYWQGLGDCWCWVWLSLVARDHSTLSERDRLLRCLEETPRNLE